MRHTFVFALVLVMMVWNAATGQAATIAVTAGEVAVNAGNGKCSLREAIANAEAGGDSSGGDCTAGTGSADTIALALSNYDLGDLVVSDAVYGSTGLPEIHSDVTLHGNGATIRRTAPTCIGTGAFRLLFIAVGGKLAIDDVTLSNGCADFSSSGAGGAIFNRGVLTIDKSTVTGNSALSSAGAIQNDGELTITRSTLSLNSTTSGAGGAVVSTGKLTLLQSTLNNNTTPGAGGALFNSTASSPATIANSTISTNQSEGTGGGVQNNSNGALTNVTVAFNRGTASAASPGQGSGIYSTSGTFTLANSIIAEQFHGTNCAGSLSSIIANLDDDATCPAPATTSGSVNLGPLANNGGDTATHALLSGSSARDTGDNTVCAASPVNNVDQRGITRPAGDGSPVCDIGAFEALRDKGETCGADDDCEANNCVDGICCEASCTGTCAACAMALTGQPNGTCAAVSAGKKTESGCNGTTGVCDGSSNGAAACVGAPGSACGVDSLCASGFCTDGFCCDVRCDDICASCAAATTGQANGTCAPVSAGKTDDGCTGTTGLCDGSVAGPQACVGALGDPCISPTLCASGFCTDGVCCESACTEFGHSCSAQGSAGQCIEIHKAVPLLSDIGLALTLTALAIVGMLSLRRARAF